MKFTRKYNIGEIARFDGEERIILGYCDITVGVFYLFKGDGFICNDEALDSWKEKRYVIAVEKLIMGETYVWGEQHLVKRPLTDLEKEVRKIKKEING